MSTTLRLPLRALIAIATAILLAVGLFAAAPAAPAFATPCNYGKAIYCDGGDEPAWQWDGVDDIDCVGIPGISWDGDTINYSGVVGQVYRFQGGSYVLVHDSTPAPAAPAAPPAPAAPAAPAPAANTSTETTTEDAPTATPTPTPTPTAAAAGGASTVRAQGDLRAGGAVSLSGSGFDPETELVIEVHSTPRTLGTTSVDKAGAFDIDVKLPADLEPGVHTIVVLADGKEVASSSITVVGAEQAGSSSGAIWLLAALAVVAGALLAGYFVIRARRARTTPVVADVPVV